MTAAFHLPALFLVLLVLCPAAAVAAEGESSKGANEIISKGPKCAVVNQVHFHLEIIAGAVYILQQLSSHPVTVYLPAKVVKNNWYGFLSWMGNMEGVIWKDYDDYDFNTQYDLAWFVTPEFPPPFKHMNIEQHADHMKKMIEKMQPKVLMYMIHNGHMSDKNWEKLIPLASKEVPVLTLAPHVTASVAERASTGQNMSLPMAPDWILPIYPFQPANPCTLDDLVAGRQCIRGFSVQGRIERARRNYTEVWEQIGGHRKHHTSKAISNFRLNILGETVEAFSVPVEVRDLVAVYKNPPYPIFYDVVHHSFGLVPMLASALYYKSKFSSTVVTSMITGVPIIADKKMLDAYHFVDRKAVFYQDDSKTELDVMFEVTRMKPEEMWRTRAAVGDLRDKMNARAKKMIVGWLEAKGLPIKGQVVKAPAAEEGAGGGGGGGGSGKDADSKVDGERRKDAEWRKEGGGGGGDKPKEGEWRKEGGGGGDKPKEGEWRKEGAVEKPREDEGKEGSERKEDGGGKGSGSGGGDDDAPSNGRSSTEEADGGAPAPKDADLKTDDQKEVKSSAGGGDGAASKSGDGKEESASSDADGDNPAAEREGREERKSKEGDASSGSGESTEQYAKRSEEGGGAAKGEEEAPRRGRSRDEAGGEPSDGAADEAPRRSEGGSGGGGAAKGEEEAPRRSEGPGERGARGGGGGGGRGREPDAEEDQRHVGSDGAPSKGGDSNDGTGDGGTGTRGGGGGGDGGEEVTPQRRVLYRQRRLQQLLGGSGGSSEGPTGAAALQESLGGRLRRLAGWAVAMRRRQ